VARVMQEGGLGTFLFDLLTPKEEEIDDVTRELRFNIPFLADRMVTVTKWLRGTDATKDLNVGYFGASTGGGAAIVAAARLKGDPQVKAVVSRGGRPDLAGPLMSKLKKKI
jgi:dienelactone hydrolase